MAKPGDVIEQPWVGLRKYTDAAAEKRWARMEQRIGFKLALPELPVVAIEEGKRGNIETVTYRRVVTNEPV